MNKFSCSSFLLSLFIFLHFLLPSVSDNTALINQICRPTSDFGFCIQTLKPFHITDIKVATQVTIQQSVIYAENTRKFIEQAKGSTKDPKLKPLYVGCGADYDVVISLLKDAGSYFAAANYGNMSSALGESERPIMFCQESISYLVFPMLEKNREMRVLLSMALYEVSLLR